MSTRWMPLGGLRSGNALVIVLVIVFAVICFALCSRLKKAEQEVAEVRAEQQEEAEAKEAAEAAKRAPFHDIDAALRYASHILHVGDTLFFGTRDEYLKSEAGRALLERRKGGEAGC